MDSVFSHGLVILPRFHVQQAIRLDMGLGILPSLTANIVTDSPCAIGCTIRHGTWLSVTLHLTVVVVHTYQNCEGSLGVFEKWFMVCVLTHGPMSLRNCECCSLMPPSQILLAVAQKF